MNSEKKILDHFYIFLPFHPFLPFYISSLSLHIPPIPSLLHILPILPILHILPILPIPPFLPLLHILTPFSFHTDPSNALYLCCFFYPIISLYFQRFCFLKIPKIFFLAGESFKKGKVDSGIFWFSNFLGIFFFWRMRVSIWDFCFLEIPRNFFLAGLVLKNGKKIFRCQSVFLYIS